MVRVVSLSIQCNNTTKKGQKAGAHYRNKTASAVSMLDSAQYPKLKIHHQHLVIFYSLIMQQKQWYIIAHMPEQNSLDPSSRRAGSLPTLTPTVCN